MIQLIRHRGPDDTGIFHEEGVVLAHARLAIEGTQKQPVEITAGALVFNGECYGSAPDTEIIKREWRKGHFNDLNGIFAIAVWDGALHLFRDRHGTKPLYCTKVGKDFLFASEIKAFLAHPGFHVKVDEEALAEYWTFQNYLEPTTTLFKGVEMVPPITGTPAEPKKIVQSILDQKTKNEYGVYLSGGLDSGVIANVLSPCKSFSVGFEGGDERSDSEELARLLGTEHYECYVTRAMANAALKEIVWHLEEPRMGQCHPNWYAAKLASKFVRVVYSGTGGDELFGGYIWRYGKDRDQFWRRLPPVLDQTKAVQKLNDLYPDKGFEADLEFEKKTFLHGLLVLEDKISMAHSLETRVPLLDNGLEEWAKTQPHYDKPQFRSFMRTISPRLADKKKQGFSANDGDWFNRPIHPAVYDYIEPVKTTNRLYNWSLAYFSEWCEVWL